MPNEEHIKNVSPTAALYVRLSKEDRHKTNKDDDSESIINQQNMLIDFCTKQNWNVYDIYNDEDFSGSDRDRPDFNRMINDARDHKFDVWKSLKNTSMDYFQFGGFALSLL